MFTSGGYQSNPAVQPSLDQILKEVVTEVKQEHISPVVQLPPSRNLYTVAGGSLVMYKDLRVVPNVRPVTFSNEHVLNLPVPAQGNQLGNMTELWTIHGNKIFMTIDDLGRIELTGTFDVNDELPLSFYPYVAKIPLQTNAL